MNSTTSPIQEAQELVNYPKTFAQKLLELKGFRIYHRVESWIVFFNSNYSRCRSFYSTTLTAVLDFAIDHPLFYKQTNHEMELSFGFYWQIMSAKPELELENEDSAKHLLTIALIFGKFPGMAVGSIRKVFLKNYNHVVSSRHLEEIFEYTFIKYENPKLLTQRLPQLSLLEINLLMHLLQGNSARTFLNLPLRLSRKEAALFPHCKTFHLNLNDRSLEKMLLITKLHVVVNNSALVSRFLKANHYFNYRLNEFMVHFSFWKSALQFLTTVNWAETYLGVTDYVDFFVHKRHIHDSNYSLKGRTNQSVNSAIYRWHNTGSLKTFKQLLKSTWGIARKDTVVFANAVYQFTEITSGKLLFQESEKMSHCAFSYLQSCINGYTSVWSVTRKNGLSHTPLLTLELCSGEVTQIVQKNNAAPSALDYALVKHWALENKYEFSGL